MELTDNEKVIIQARVKLDTAMEKLNVTIKERDDLLANEDVKNQQAKVAIANVYKDNIDNLTIQKEQAEKNYKILLTEEK
jgi:hypothetical protein